MEENAWPPNQPKEFTPLLLIHHQGPHTIVHSAALAKVIQRGSVDDLMLTSRDNAPNHHTLRLHGEEVLDVKRILESGDLTKCLIDILAPVEMFSIYTTLTKGQRPSFKEFLQQARPSFVKTF